VLVYCMAGQSRSPSTVVAYFMKDEGMQFGDAYNRVKRGRKQATDPIEVAEIVAAGTGKAREREDN